MPRPPVSPEPVIAPAMLVSVKLMSEEIGNALGWKDGICAQNKLFCAAIRALMAAGELSIAEVDPDAERNFNAASPRKR